MAIERLSGDLWTKESRNGFADLLRLLILLELCLEKGGFTINNKKQGCSWGFGGYYFSKNGFEYWVGVKYNDIRYLTFTGMNLTSQAIRYLKDHYGEDQIEVEEEVYWNCFEMFDKLGFPGKTVEDQIKLLSSFINDRFCRFEEARKLDIP